MLFICVLSRNRGKASIFVWNNLVYVQLFRLLPLIDFEVPPYYLVFNREFAKVFDITEVFSEDDG
jgi:hypothetical protein